MCDTTWLRGMFPGVLLLYVEKEVDSPVDSHTEA